MKFIPAKCPSCNGELRVPDDLDFVKCLYCGIDVKVRDAIAVKLSFDTKNFKTLAKHNIEIGNFEEANKYFTSILENEIDTYQAWEGKAEIILKTFNISCLKNTEFLKCLDNSLKYFKGDNFKNYQNKICNMSIEYNKLIISETDDILKSTNSIDNWQLYISLNRIVLSNLQYTYKYFDYANLSCLKLILYICEQNLKINDDFRNIAQRNSRLPDIKNLNTEMVSHNEYNKLILDEAINVIKIEHPNYFMQYENWQKKYRLLKKNHKKNKLVVLLLIAIICVTAIIVSIFANVKDSIVAILIIASIIIVGISNYKIQTSQVELPYPP